jgi:hypothetical protein
MFRNCSFGNHEYGLPRLVESGVVASECMHCLHVKRAPAPFVTLKPAEPEARPQIGARLASVVSGAGRFAKALRVRTQLNEVGSRAA